MLTYSDVIDGNQDVFIRDNGFFVGSTPAGSGTFTDTDADPGDHSYVLRYRPDGVLVEVPCTPSPITVNAPAPPPPPPAATCTAALNGAGDPVLTYSGVIDGNQDVFIRDNGFFVDSTPAGSGTYTDTDADPGDHSYVIRYRPNGALVEVPCTPSPITVGGATPPPPPPPPPGAGPTCTAALNGAGDPVLTYSDVVDGNQDVFIRDNGFFVGSTPAGSGTFTDTDANPGDHSYVIRHRPGGVLVEVPCTPSPITVGGATPPPPPPPPVGPTCTAALNGAGQPVLTYSGLIDGNALVFVQFNGFFLASTPSGSGTFTHADATPGTHTYAIRTRPGGIVNDVVCPPIINTVGGAPPPPPGAGPTCTAALNGAGQPVLTYSGLIDGNDLVFVQFNGFFLASTPSGSGTFTHADAAPGTHTYAIRTRPGGVVNDVVCTPNPITVGGATPPPAGTPCTATVTANGSVSLAWTQVAGTNVYVVRDNDGWVATPNAGALSFTDGFPESGSRTYMIRHWVNGGPVDRACNTVSVP